MTLAYLPTILPLVLFLFSIPTEGRKKELSSNILLGIGASLTQAVHYNSYLPGLSVKPKSLTPTRPAFVIQPPVGINEFGRLLSVLRS